ncbi:hypothetical protein [Kordia sp.]|uniref:hypothetical protein n=1 Tax=Kordia sp. TaxID=1965332 RepID=UPI003D6A4444
MSNRNDLKQYFETGKKPTQQEYEDLIDSTVNKSDDKANLEEAANEAIDDKYITPKTAKRAVETHLPNATTSQAGIVRRSTATEVDSGANVNAYVTPLNTRNIIEDLAPGLAPVQSVNGLDGHVVLNLGNSSTDRGSTREGILKFYYTPNSTTDIFHIKLPYRTDTDNKMFYLKASGYAYQSSEIIDIVWVGYCYQSGSTGNKLLRTQTDVSRSSSITAGQYEGSDKHIYLWLKVGNTNHTTFKVDSMRVGNGTLLEDGALQVIVSDQLEL